MNYETIFDGVYHFSQALSEDNIDFIITEYNSYKKNLYRPVLKSGYPMSLEMLCFGKHWSALDYKYHDKRVDYDNESVELYDLYYSLLASQFSKIVFPNHNTYWDIAIMNFYKQSSKLGLHRDDSESKETLTTGHPVVSFSVGYDSIFRVGGLNRNDEYKDVLLKNGDVIIFGGPSRLRYHGITGIIKTENSPIDGRINLTLRKY